MNYQEFLDAKTCVAEQHGFDVPLDAINPALKPHQKSAVQWAVRGGRRALFEAFGLGKSVQQLEIVRLCAEYVGGRGLIVCPLGVRQEFVRDAVEILGWETPPKFIRRIEDADETGIYITNYETIRDGKMDPIHFAVASLDEASILRGFGGTKTFREFMALFAGDRKTMNDRTRRDALRFRFVATATPSPNDYIEMLAYSAFLGVMDVSAAKTRFFKRNSEKADQLTIHAHKEREFWLWIASWALFVTKPSDLDPSFSDEGYVLPDLDIRWHEVPSDHSTAGHAKNGQALMFANTAIGIQDAAREKRLSLDARVAKMMEIRAEAPDDHRLIWHDLESERKAIESSIPGISTVYGSQKLDDREEAILAFSNGETQELAAKPVIAGSGCNFQRHCRWAIFLGIGFKFNDFIQAIHRVHRFLQTGQVRIDLIYTEAERDVRKKLETKWEQHKKLVENMTKIIKEYGLDQIEAAQRLERAMGVERVEVSGEGYKCVNNDCVAELRTMEADSIGCVLTSIPFSTQYEYSPNFADFGHTDNNAHFWEQMDYLIPEIFRVLQPGRKAFIHVKDRVVPTGMTDYGFQTVYPLHMDTIVNFTKHGFGHMGMYTISTDVVRENNQTYRLGWSEQCKDASKMGCGMPEYLLIFRKPATDRSNGYADEPVQKTKENYTRARWQLDAHALHKSSGNSLLMPEELEGLPADQVYKLFRKHSQENLYDFEHDVRLGESLEVRGCLPPTFMLMQPRSQHQNIWDDITRMRTLNGMQAAKGREMHLCPMQFDIADRVIERETNPGDTILDPFGGLMTVPYRAVLKGRKGIGVELSPAYFADGVYYCEQAAREMSTPDLFDALEMVAREEAA